MQNQKGNISVIVSFIIVIGLIGLVVYSLMHQPVKVNPLEGITNGEVNNTPESTTPTTPSEESVTTPTKVMNPNAKLLTNFKPVSEVTKLEKIDVVVGTGEVVAPGATVSVHYTGAVAATGVIFQSSKDFGPTPVTFPLANVIKGWTDGIPGMKVGGTRRLIIPAAEAYGATPPPGSGIPANAALVFDVELVSISK
jgi:FKBP-type peptidyl-prolyl cis-trans isomerase